jgi:type I restriction enzyme M protein
MTTPTVLDQSHLAWIANFIWNIADDVLRDVYVRGKYRDVILPMVVIRRLDAVLEPTKDAVLRMKALVDSAGIANPDAALRQAAGQAFYNTSPFSLRDLRHRARAQQLKADFEAYLDGFSPNVQDVLEKFEFRNQVPRLVGADILGDVIEKFLDPTINLAPHPVLFADGSVRLPALDNHGMGTIFEELIRRFNEENNEEAGEHFTPRDVVELMARLIFLPIAGQITPGTYTVYDGACGTGGMLTVAEETLRRLAAEQGKDVRIHLFGQEVNAETYAISKADLLLKGEGEEAENFAYGSTLSQDGFLSRTFDFMLSNPPYGKSWKKDLERLGGERKEIRDPRFVVEHAGDPEFSLVTRSSDGQLMFLANMIAKMKDDTRLGSRIAEVHNGSSLFTGEAGRGESNARQWILENDWLEAIVALPGSIFYNTGIATYVWLLSNRKPEHRRGKVQLIDATSWYRPLRKNLGKKNCVMAEEDIRQVCEAFLAFEETPESKIFPNEAFGYWQLTVKRPLRLRAMLNAAAVERVREHATRTTEPAAAALDARVVAAVVENLVTSLGPGPHLDWNVVEAAAEESVRGQGAKLTAARRKLLRELIGTRDPAAAPVIATVHTSGRRGAAAVAADPLHGRYEATVDGRRAVVSYEADATLADTEQVPMLEPGGIGAFIEREVLLHAPDAWVDEDATKTGYEISFTRYFYQPPALRSLDEISADILALEQETEGLLHAILDAVPSGAAIGNGAQG